MYQMCINCRWNSGCCNDTTFISTHQCLIEPRSLNFSSSLHTHHCSFSIRWWYKRGLVTKDSHFSHFKCTQQYKYLFIQNQVCLWSIRPLFSTYLRSGCGGSSLDGTLPTSPRQHFPACHPSSEIWFYHGVSSLLGAPRRLPKTSNRHPNQIPDCPSTLSYLSAATVLWSIFSVACIYSLSVSLAAWTDTDQNNCIELVLSGPWVLVHSNLHGWQEMMAWWLMWLSPLKLTSFRLDINTVYSRYTLVKVTAKALTVLLFFIF